MLMLPRTLLLVAFLLAPAGAVAREAGGETTLPTVAAAPRPQAPIALPEARSDLWRRSEALEAAGDYRGAATLRMRILARDPDDTHVLWRVARDLLHEGTERMAAEPDAAARSFDAARVFARRGRESDPSCGECCLYEFASTARLASVRGVARSLVTVRAAGGVLEQCLEMPPTWSDALFGAEAAHLYYGAAVYFRVLPSTRVFAWLGIAGDAERAVGFARRAAAVSPHRADYRVELGAALLCQARRAGDPAARAEGEALLRTFVDAGPDGAAGARAIALLSEPDAACANSAHGDLFRGH